MRYNKTNSFIAYINQNKLNKDSPVLPDLSLSLNHKRNSTINKNINHMPHASYDITAFNENCKCQLSKINSSLYHSDKSITKGNNENEIEIESQFNLEREQNYSGQYGSTKKRKKEIDNTNGTTRDTKENKLDVNNITSNGSNKCFDIINSNSSKEQF
jgi:hypothetical protein